MTDFDSAEHDIGYSDGLSGRLSTGTTNEYNAGYSTGEQIYLAQTSAMSLFDEFISGIMDATGFHRVQANEQWAAYSRQMSDTARSDIERGGHSNGLTMGSEILALV
jgi:transposase